MTDIRTLLGASEPYWSFCREERNLAALLYHLLLCGDNLEKFCQAVGYEQRLSDPAVYFEYSRLRDLWYCIGGTRKGAPDVDEANATKRQVIIELLAPSNASYLSSCSVVEFNHFFGAVPQPSTWCIQSPSVWSVSRFAESITEPDEVLRTCMFKWAFNAKPDIVIHADADHALCIEAKLESGEGYYPTSSAERAIFGQLGLPYVSQTELQKYLMENLLGLETELLMLVSRVNDHVTGHRMVSWEVAFGSLVYERQPGFVNAWAKKVLGLG